MQHGEMSFSDLRHILASDTLLACFFPLIILIIGYKHFSYFNLTDLRDLLSIGPRNRPGHGHFSLERAYHSFDQYAQLSARELSQMRASYGKLGRVNKNIGYKIGYPKKLDRLRDVTALNATITAGITELALDEFALLKSADSLTDTNTADLGRVRESLKHYVRDWSEEGMGERTRIFAPILDLLKEIRTEDRGEMKVLVPGCGLGRLAWEISELGFYTTANELSFFMTLALRFLFSSKTTKFVNEHTLRPYAHWFSHQRSNESLFRRISFPDVVPRFSSTFRLAEGNFLELKAPSHHGSGLNGYDYIVTLFFIDTSLDVLATMSHMYNLLRPGGTWINMGPLLWTGGGQAKVELSLEEVLQAAEEIGFILEVDETSLASRKTVECEYTGDKNAMMRWIYKAEFWVARKPKES